MMRHIVSAASGMLFCATVAMAESQQGVVVELYTSQGCSSCPPADELMGKLANTPGVIGLALHVDYWDYIGWADTFGNPKHADRQRNYAHARGEKMIYTPQMIVAGLANVEGNQPSKVNAAIAAAKRETDPVTLSVTRDGGKLSISAKANAPLPGKVSVQLVHYTDSSVVKIKRGENAGLNMTYHNIVTSWQTIGDWSGVEPLQMVTDAGQGPVVVILQAKGPREIVAAARLK